MIIIDVYNEHICLSLVF